MKNKNCLKLTAWVLILTLTMGICLSAATAEPGTPEMLDVASPAYSHGIVLEETVLDSTFVQSATIVNQKNTTIADISKENPNNQYTLKLKVKEPENAESDEQKLPSNTDEVSLVYELGDNMIAVDGSNQTVAWEFDAESRILEFSWVNGYQNAFDADITVIPASPAENDLSGSYILGTAGNEYYSVLLGSTPFMDGNRGRVKGYPFTEVNGKVFSWTEDAAAIWELKHVSGNYYTVRSRDNGKYMKIVPSTNGLILEDANETTAQKLLLEDVGNGYYSFRFENKSVNNSSFNATKGFASYAYEKGTNAILKLYNPSDVMTEAGFDLSGTWVLTNTQKKNTMSAEAQSSGRLKGIGYTLMGDLMIGKDDAETFTFEHIIRDWYTVKTESGYLNISKDGAFISANPQHLLVRTDRDYSTIILTNGGVDDACYTLTNVNGKTSDGYGTVAKATFNDNSRLTLYPSSSMMNEQMAAGLTFDANGGTGDTAPEGIHGVSGETIVLPDLNATKNGQEFIGWADVNNIYAQNAGTSHRYHDLYKPGTNYKLKAGIKKLYAIYNPTARKVQFGIRMDGKIQDEPNNYDTGAYKGHFTVDGILKEGHWVIDIDSTKPVDGYYVKNNVTAALNWVPSAEEIAAALKKEGNIDFNPETQYIHYYVLKCTNVDNWHVDGVIRNKANVEITYNANVPGTEKTQITNMPGAYQVAPGTDIMIGTDQNSTEVKRPGRKGYFFMGWNTEADGTGVYYNESTIVHMKENLNLYAQWIAEEDHPLEIRIVSDWPEGKIGYVGARITLTAQLTGFEDKIYTLQWQYTTDGDNWHDVPDAHEIAYTYSLDEVNTHYIWRVVAQDIR